MPSFVVIHDAAFAEPLIAKGYKPVRKKSSGEFVFADSPEIRAVVFTGGTTQHRSTAKRETVVATPEQLLALLTGSA